MKFFLKTLFLTIILLVISLLGYKAHAASPTDPPPGDSLSTDASLGHLQCIIRADTNCTDQTVTLEAWLFYVFTGQYDPVIVNWSTGATAHKIVVAPPGNWSWDATNFGCDHFFNQIAYEDDFFDGPLTLTTQPNDCAGAPPAIVVDTAGYAGFSSFNWSPAGNILSPYQVEEPGDYSLTVTDALGCTATAEINVPAWPVSTENCFGNCPSCGDLDGYQSSNAAVITELTNPFCGVINPHNDVWIGFIAGDSTISLEVVPTNCQNGDGLQLAFFDNCSDADALECNPGCSGCGEVPLSITYAGFTPGATYWLVVDGYVADVCDFTVNLNEGSTIAPAPVPAGPVSGQQVLCPGGTAVYSVAPAEGAGYYHWRAPQGASINGLGNDVQLSGPTGATVFITFSQQTGNVCVSTGNACYPETAASCLPVSVTPIPFTIKPDLVLCSEDLPYVWDEEPFFSISNPGTYTFTSTPYNSYLGCDSLVRQTIVVKPAIIVSLGEQTICKGDCLTFGNEQFCETGNYISVFESALGCDSLVSFFLTVLEPVAEITGPNTLSCDQSSITLGSAPSFGIKAWRNESGTVLGTGNSLIVGLPGTYILETTVSLNGIECRASDTITITIESSLTGLVISGNLPCSGDTITLNCSPEYPGATYLWSGPDGYQAAGATQAIAVAGEYQVVVTLANGCSGTASANVSQLGTPPGAFAQGDTLFCNDADPQLNGGSDTPGVTFQWSGPNGFASAEEDPLVNEAGEYQLIVTAPSGCTSVAFAYLTINQEVPLFELSDSVRIVCDSFPTLLVSTNIISYAAVWSGPNGFVSSVLQPQVDVPGLYQLILTNLENQCTAAGSIAVTSQPGVFSFNDVNITAPVIGQNNGSIELNVVSLYPIAEYRWTLNGVQIGSNEDIDQLSEGWYILYVEDVYGCIASDTFNLEGVSSTQQAELAAWTALPNPSSGLFVVTAPNSVAAADMSVLDANGRVIWRRNHGLLEKITEIDLSNAPAGVYFLHIQATSRSFWEKIVVQR